MRGAVPVSALDSGARQGELWALEWADIDLASGAIRISKSLKDDGTKLSVGPTKGKKERSMVIAPTTILALKALRAKNPDKRPRFPQCQMAASIAGKTSTGAIGSVSCVRPGSTAAGFTFHDLRHSCATMLIRHGESIANVSKRLGHSKISTTLDYYAHALPEDDLRPCRCFRIASTSILCYNTQSYARLAIARASRSVNY